MKITINSVDSIHFKSENSSSYLISASVSAAFSTRLDEDTELTDSPVIFGRVDLNIGDGYDEFTGKNFS